VIDDHVFKLALDADGVPHIAFADETAAHAQVPDDDVAGGHVDAAVDERYAFGGRGLAGDGDVGLIDAQGAAASGAPAA
jgi:hypothetical protein